jgi:hypothetical protein
MNPESFRCAIGTIKDAVNELGRKALEAVIATAESTEDVLDREGRRHRFKQVTPKNWITPFGRISVDRRYYQQDSGGDGFAPIDIRCGMVDRFMTADVEKMAAFTAAMLTPSEVECRLVISSHLRRATGLHSPTEPRLLCSWAILRWLRG